MQTWKRWLLILVAAILVLGILCLAVAYFFTDFIVDYWWFDSLGYGLYFWERILYRYIVLVLTTLLFFVIFFLNFWIASRFLGTTTPVEAKTNAEAQQSYQKLFRRFREGSLIIYFPLSLVLAIIIAIPLFHSWQAALLYVFGSDSGVHDPVYGKDISYYLFSFPIYILVFKELLATFIVLLVGLALLYWLESRILSKHDRHLPRGAKIHLNILVILVFFIGIWGFILQRHQLLYVDSHMPLFYGPGFVEMHVTLPLIWASIVFLAGMGLSFIFLFDTKKRISAFIWLIVFIAFFSGGLWARYSSFLPDLIQEYIVRPNESAREKPYIANNIQSTLAAYNLQNVETREFAIQNPPWDTTSPNIKQNLRNIPVWNGEILHTVFQQEEEIRTYYNFPSVDVDRYTVNDVYQQVFLAPREIDFQALPEIAQNWVNEWLKYTHGYGAVMVPAAQSGEEPMNWFMQGIPPQSNYGLSIKEPAIYYGLGPYNPVIAPNESHELDYPSEQGSVLTDYKGRGGIRISNLFREFVFALYFKERNILFTTQYNDNSRILIKRNIIDRIKTLAPFLTLDRDPYVVITPEKIYWIQDAYTSSNWYPYAYPYNEKLNYIRNSVKIVVDAYDGTVNFFIAYPKDPIVQAYSRIYPGLFKDFDQMPVALKPHVRYPQDIFDIQMRIYANYHQTEPELFYKQEDVWAFPQVQRRQQVRTITPYYLTLNLINQNKFEFLLLTPMIPRGRNNLRALALVGCDGDNYGKMVVYSFPKGTLVYGPPQIEALIEQDPSIAEQFTLWNQGNSQVDRGSMIVIPVGGVVIYVQPVYLASTAAASIPELKRIIVSQGEEVVMEPSIEESFAKLNQKLSAEIERQKETQQELKAPPESPQVLPEGSSDKSSQPTTD